MRPRMRGPLPSPRRMHATIKKEPPNGGSGVNREASNRVDGSTRIQRTGWADCDTDWITNGKRASRWAPQVRRLLLQRLEERALLAQDEALLLGEAEVGGALGVGLEPGPVGLVGRQAVEGDQPPGDGVGPLVRQEVADEAPPALGDDAAPVAGVFGERLAL